MEKRDAGGETQIRSFVAIDICDEVRSGLDKIISELKPRVGDIRWVRAKSVHLTLKFLGDVSESMIPSLRKVIEEVALSVKPFNIEVKGLGAFPNPRNARVVWVGVEEPSGVLKDLAGRIDDGMKSLGFEPESREFNPHLTLGRVRKGGRPGKELQGLIERDRERRLGSFEAGEFVLFRSDLKPEGAVYTKLETAQFGGKE